MNEDLQREYQAVIDFVAYSHVPRAEVRVSPQLGPGAVVAEQTA